MMTHHQLTRRRRLASAAAAVSLAVITACGSSGDDGAGNDDPTGTSTTLRPGNDAGPDPLDPASDPEVDATDPEAVATAWGCGYWAHPLDETSTALAERLEPLSTPAVTVALAELRMSGMDGVTVSASAGATVPAGANTWLVHCTTTAAGTSGPLTPSPVEIEVRVAPQPDGTWRVDLARHPDSGLTIGQ